MKKSFLLLAAGLVAGIANGQTISSGSSANLVNNPVRQPQELQVGGQQQAFWNGPVRTGAKTTSIGGRWYDYVIDYMQPYQQTLGADVNYYSPNLWNDTTALFGYTGTTTPYFFNNLLSLGMGLDPWWNMWNCTTSTGGGCVMDFTGAMAVTHTDNYTIDSVFVPGWYTRNLAKPTVVDTLIFAFVQGNGGATTDLPHNTLTGVVVPMYCASCTALDFLDLYHDQTNNRAAANGGTPVTTIYKYLLNNTDTCVNAYKAAIFPRPGHSDATMGYAVSAGNYMAMTVTFKSGDATYGPHGGPGDTVRYSDGTTVTGYKYNVFQAQTFYAASSATSTTPTWAPYNADNVACAYWGFEGRGWPAPFAKYYPNWDIISTLTPLAPASAQYPHIGYHIACPSCPLLPLPATLGTTTVNSVSILNVFPNPANNELNIYYTAANGTTINATLTNILGEVVATQTSSNSKVLFNIGSLPNGIYVYTLEANGQRTTGRISVAH
jgi:Secretion system C-terminal sorting domain